MVSTEEKFRSLIQLAGYKTLGEFAEVVGIDYNNIRRNMRMEHGYKVQLDRIFKYANALGVTVESLLWLFYPERMEENHKIVAGEKSLEIMRVQNDSEEGKGE